MPRLGVAPAIGNGLLSNMDDAIKQRMRLAIEAKGLDCYQASKMAGLNRNYLYEAFHRNKGSEKGFLKIAAAIGLSFPWLLQGKGGVFEASLPGPAYDTDSIIAAFEVILEATGLDLAMARDAALTILEIAAHPPNDNSATDRRCRIRSGILGALRVYARPKSQ